MIENLKTALLLMLIGMGVVMIALVSLQLFVNGISVLDLSLTRIFNRKKEKDTTKPVENSLKDQQSDIESEEAAVIAAAVAAATTGHAVVHHVRLLSDGSQESWSREGRLDIMRSHSPSQKK